MVDRPLSGSLHQLIFFTLMPNSLLFDFKMRKKRAVEHKHCPSREEKNTFILTAFAKSKAP
jgi:hypothetical protein